MKTQETTPAQMDDIVFENRNKSYGAYILRKTYNKQLYRGLLVASAILIAGLAYPVVSSYNLVLTGKVIDDPGPVIVLTQPKDEIRELPKLPKTEPAQKPITFTRPVVVEGEVPGDIDLLDMDLINSMSKNGAIDISPDIPTAIQPVIIEQPEETQKTFTIVEEQPSFIGGETERLRFLKININYPDNAASNGIQGTVYVQFIIDSKGNITDAKILRGIGGGCDEEALRVINSMPPWHPGKQNGKAVRVLFNMPIVFKLAS